MSKKIGIIFQPHEDAYVAAVNELTTKVGEQQLAIGRLTDQFLDQSGGTKYGDSTLKRIARHPDLACSVMEITRCWNLYRMGQQYGDLLSGARFCISAKYELARVMPKQLPEPEKQELVAGLVKDATGQTVTEIAKLVSDRLRARGQLRRPKTAKPPASAAEVLPTKPIVTDTPRPSRVDYLAAADTIAHLGKTDPVQLLGATDLRRLVILALTSLAEAVEAVAGPAMDEELATMVTAMAERMTAAATRRQKHRGPLRLLGPGEEVVPSVVSPANPPEQNDTEFEVISGEVYPAIFRSVRYDAADKFCELTFDIAGRFSVYGRATKLQTLKRWARALGAANGHITDSPGAVAVLDRQRGHHCQVRMTTGDQPWPVVGDILAEILAEAV